MKYKRYTGSVEVDEESKVLYGRVIGLRDMITYEAQSFAELEKAFRDSVDVYLNFCAERGESPEKPFSGQLLLRLPPELHRELSHSAETKKVSLNSLIQTLLEGHMRESGTDRSTRDKVEKPRKHKSQSTGGASGIRTQSAFGEMTRKRRTEGKIMKAPGESGRVHRQGSVRAKKS